LPSFPHLFSWRGGPDRQETGLGSKSASEKAHELQLPQ